MSNYENFRTVLMMNLMNTSLSPEQLTAVLNAVDVTANDFEISRKPMEIIQASDGSEYIVKCFLGAMAVANRSQGTLKQYRYKLKHFFDTVRKPYREITANDIRIYLGQFKIERHASGSYLESVRITINSFFQWLEDNEYIPRNPCRTVESIRFQPVRRQPMSTFALEDLRWNCQDIREKALVDFLFATGCRVSECAGVLLSDIDWEKNAVRIRHGKGDKERIVYFNDEAKITLREYLKSRQDDTPALWVSTRAPHQQLKAHALENIVGRIGRRISVHAYPHKLRHTFATVALNSGMPLPMLQALLGHADPKTTLIYAHQDNRQLHMEHQKVFC